MTSLHWSDWSIPAGGKLNYAYVTEGGKNSKDMVILRSFSQAAQTVKVRVVVTKVWYETFPYFLFHSIKILIWG